MADFAQQHRPQRSHIVNSAKTVQAKPQPVPVPEPQSALSNQAVQRLLRTGTIQAKLTVNEPGDKYEQEADRVAEQVMRMPDTKVSGISQSLTNIQRACAACASGKGFCPTCATEKEGIQHKPLAHTTTPLTQRQSSGLEEEEEEGLQAKEAPGQTPTVTPNIETQINAIGGGGKPLPGSVRSNFDSRFGHDFSNVRIHTGPKAAETARAVNARAFTVGQDVVFGTGEYSPETASGQRLLAHELTHVIQQTDSGGEQSRRPAPLQRTIGDGHDLTAPRFSGNVELEEAFDPGERLIRVGNRGAYVTLIQQSLLAMGYTLPEHGADGIFGLETKAAVEQFQRDAAAVLIDGIVGPETMNLLDQHDVTNVAGSGPPAITGPVPSPRPTVGAGCAQHFTSVTFALANQTATGVTPAADIRVASVGGRDLLSMRGIAPANYTPEVTVNAPDDPTAREYEVGLIQNLLSETLVYTYSTGARIRSTLPTPIKDGAPLSSGIYHPIFAENGGGHPGILESFTANGDDVDLNLPDTPSDAAFINLLDNPECGALAAGTLTSAVFRDQFRTWIGVRHRPSGCVITIHHIDWSTDWSVNCASIPIRGAVCVPATNTITVTQPNGNGSPRFIQGGQVPADLLATNRVCGP